MKQPARSQSLLAIMVLSATIILSTLVVWSDLQEAEGSIVQSNWDQIQSGSDPFTLALTGNASKHFDNEINHNESEGEDQIVSESKLVPSWEKTFDVGDSASLTGSEIANGSQEDIGDLQESASTYQKTHLLQPRRKRRRKSNKAQWKRNFQRSKPQQLFNGNPNRPYYQQLKKKKKIDKHVNDFPNWNTFQPHRPKTTSLFPATKAPNPMNFRLNTIESEDDLPSNGRGFNTKVLNKVTAFLNSSENETDSAPPIDRESYSLPIVHAALYDHNPWKPYTQAPRVRTIAKESNYYYDARLVPVDEISDLDLKPTPSKLAGRQQRRSFRSRSKKKPYKALVQVYKSTNRGYPGPVESTTDYNFDVFPTHQQLNDDDYYFDNFVKEFADEFPEKEAATTPVPPVTSKDVIQSRYEESILIPDDHVKDIYEDYFYVDDPDYAQPEPKRPPPPPTTSPSRPHTHGPYRALRQTGYPVRYRKQAPHPRRPPVTQTGYPEYDQYQPNIPITPIPNYRFPKSEFNKYFPNKRPKSKGPRANKLPPRGYLKQKFVRPPVVHVAPPTAPPPRPPFSQPPPYNTPGPYYDVTQIPAEPISYESDDDEYYQRRPRPQAPGPNEYQRLQKAYMQLLAQNNKPEEEPEPVQEDVAEYDQEEQAHPRPAYQEERPDYYEDDDRRQREIPQYEDSRDRELVPPEYEDISHYDDKSPEDIFEYGAQTDERNRGLQDPREYVQRNTAHSFDAGWDEFFNGHRDNIDDDIGSISQSNENYGAPEGGSSQEQAPNQEENQPEGEHEDREHAPYDPRDYRGRDREEGKGEPAARYRGDDYDEPPDYESPGHEEYKGNSPDYERDEGTIHPVGDKDVRQRERGDYARFKHLEDQEKIAEETHDSDYDDDDYDEPAGGQRVRRPLTPMKYAHGEMVVEDFPLEETIDDEIGDDKEKKRRKWKAPSYDGEDRDKPADGSDDNVQDLRPNRYREVAPDEFDYQMPSHEELQENYKTETSSSEVDPVAVPWSPQKVKISK
ncbi:uncharacterized protein LOC131881621 isoform X2 [Tigriopus californicus]|uniref:uncharacterized protein LOC131881621 isoform X2 n=1 Tax=Tigriopus californicus TaxID=6832 RepID=UPI0027DA7DBC|nr:uncharacterized protein LOC131881621 isoform X2 [Tigriopus californicus]